MVVEQNIGGEILVKDYDYCWSTLTIVKEGLILDHCSDNNV